MADDAPSGTLFRFVSLRNPQLPTSSELESGFISYRDFLPPPLLKQSGGAASANSTFFETLARAVAKGGAGVHAALEAAVAAYRRDRKSHIDSPEELDGIFPGMRSMKEWLEETKAEIDAEAVRGAFKERLGRTVEEQVREHWPILANVSLRVWDNLFSRTIVPDHPQLREDLLAMIRLLRLLLRLATPGDKSLNQDGAILRAVEATVLLPREIFPPTQALQVRPRPTRTAGEGGGALKPPGGFDPPDRAPSARAAAVERIVPVGGSLIGLRGLCVGDVKPDPCAVYEGPPLPKTAGVVKPLGVGELMMVEQKLLRYQAGEVAHIENVLLSEQRDRTHRHLRRAQETFTQETESITVTERDTQTTERFTLESETAQTIKSEEDKKAGVTLTAKYGTVKLSANASYASSTSQSSAAKVARGYAKEVTERSAQKLTERTRFERSRTTLEEFEETNLHRFDNTNGKGNITGIYRWIDKVFQARVVRYDLRLIFEFVIPEPAAFYIYSQARGGAEGVNLVKPMPPPLSSFEEITEDNYAAWAALYGAREIPPPPAEFETASLVLHTDQADWNRTSSSIRIPSGYCADSATALCLYSKGESTYVHLAIAGRHFVPASSQPVQLKMNGETGEVPVGVRLKGTDLALTIVLTCRRLEGTYDQWRGQVFNAILSGYQEALSRYGSQLASLQSETGLSLSSSPPARNREIEREELKRGCLQLFTGQKFDAFDAVQQIGGGYPEFDNLEAQQQGDYIQFFEQAFEWEQMTYLFYPYFWGRKPLWVALRQYQDADPIFTRFLQAGAARVQVPAHPAYTKALLHYLQTDGEIWNGGEAPTLDHPLYVSLVEEIKKSGATTGPVPVGDPWEIRVPTSLVMLQTDEKLPDFS